MNESTRNTEGLSPRLAGRDIAHGEIHEDIHKVQTIIQKLQELLRAFAIIRHPMRMS